MKNTYTPTDKIDIQLNLSGLPADTWAVKYGGETLIAANVTKFYFEWKYGDFYCSTMWSKWSAYNYIHAADFARALDAWDATYNPLDNYNGRETRVNIDNYGQDDTSRTTDPLHNTVTNAAIDGTKTQDFSTTDNDTTPRLDGESVSIGGTTTTDDLHTTTSKTRQSTTLTVDGTSYTAHDVHGEIYTRAGNLGVTTTQQMITSEVEMRLNPVQKRYLDRFIYEYATYVGGAWDVWDTL